MRPSSWLSRYGTTRPPPLKGFLMKKHVLCAALLMFPATACFGGEAQTVARSNQELLQSSLQTVRLPGTAFDITVGAPAIEPGSTRVNAKLLTAIVAWLTSNYDLPRIYDPPHIEFAP